MLLQLARTNFCCVTMFEVGGNLCLVLITSPLPECRVSTDLQLKNIYTSCEFHCDWMGKEC